MSSTCNCGLANLERNELKEHKKRTGCNAKSPRYYTCNKCSTIASTKLNMLAHIRTCRQSPTIAYMREAMPINLVIKKQLPAPRIFDCAACKESFTSPAKLLIHQCGHHKYNLNYCVCICSRNAD